MNEKPRTRNTGQKTLLLTLLREAGAPLTAGELYIRAQAARPTIAKSTVYRNLEAMLAAGTVTQGLLESGEAFYSLSEPGAHTHKHYLICRGCGGMQDLPECPLGDTGQTLADSCGFMVTDHMIQIYGYCRKCRQK